MGLTVRKYPLARYIRRTLITRRALVRRAITLIIDASRFLKSAVHSAKIDDFLLYLTDFIEVTYYPSRAFRVFRVAFSRHSKYK